MRHLSGLITKEQASLGLVKPTETNQELPGSALSLAQSAVECFKGDFPLHQYRTSGAVSWKLLRHVIDADALPALKVWLLLEPCKLSLRVVCCVSIVAAQVVFKQHRRQCSYCSCW